jgi:polar amino acid transport system substrate-binding protein
MPNPPIFKGSAQRIEQVVINLVMNACQSLPDRERSIRLRTGQDLDNTGVFIALYRRDPGPAACRGRHPDRLQLRQN